ncbi:MAG: hypothetical protein ABI878_07655 [Acidobacteriota bacterium]
MVEKLTVIFFIILCLLLGVYLTLLPWVSFGSIGDWGSNYLLALISDKTGLSFIQRAIASTWFRGAVTGLGVLNLVIAFWEMAHFNQSVAMLQGQVADDPKKAVQRS